MVITLLALAAHAAPVQCNALEAARILAEARIEERRAPVTHPELIPGLAMVSARADADLRTALADLCEEGATLSLVPGDRWEDAGWAAHTFLMTRSEMAGCTLFKRTIALSVGVATDTSPRYRLRTRLPVTRIPVEDCATSPTWREEQVLAGQDGPVRLVLVMDVDDGRRVHSEVVVRRASPEGWSEQVLLEPAPSRLMDGGAGPMLALTERFEDKWVVAHLDRTGAPPDCEPIPGQKVWTWSDPDGRWVPHTGRDALGLLAQRGLWRLAGDDGWMLLLSQEDEEDAEKLAWRKRRLDRTSPEPLHTLTSSEFPGLNPGFLVVTPAPWPTRAEADLARTKATKWRRSYVKKAWTAPDPCAE
ncbi:MAG: hypothetical protein JRI25_16640 [Deltaproteobacteria bacterium]|nr:hypothetical protein [Deltaproteobacteria bacterium]